MSWIRRYSNGACQFLHSRREYIVRSKKLLDTLAHVESLGTSARSAGDESAAVASFREGVRLLGEYLKYADWEVELRLDLLCTNVRLALKCGDVAAAKQGLRSALKCDPAITQSEEWSPFFDVNAWTDEWLVASVRQEPPDAAALDVLAGRYWKKVFGHCYLLTLNHEKAGDLAQQAWVRVLRTRERLLPGGNFPAYVSTIATNLWRDAQRRSRRAGPVAEQNLVSLNQPIGTNDYDNILLAEMLPDLKSTDRWRHAMLKFDIDVSLERLTPKLRDVLIARFITGESSAAIAKRYARTEQTISGWIREAIQQMKSSLEDPLPKARLIEEAFA
jgi:RNA polymerase sigma factor (sigma-70 family)